MPVRPSRSAPLRALCAAAALAACAGAPDAADAPAPVTLTWLSVTSWLLEAGDTRILFEGYVSRVDRSTVNDDGTSTAPAPLDTAAVRTVRDALPGADRIDWILAGHAHWDHAFDVPAWAHLTDARIAGARTLCLQAAALGIDPARCTAVEGGETLQLGPDVTARVVRWHHSGDSTTAGGRILRAPLELSEQPRPDPVTGGLRPGFLEDYPSGGGARAFLITVRTPDGPLTLLWSNTGNAQAWDATIPADSAFFRQQGIDTRHLVWAPSDRPTRAHLEAALRDAGTDRVDLWIGFAGTAHVRQVAATIRPRAFAPHHWDDFWIPLADGPGTRFNAEPLRAALAESGTALALPQRPFDRIRLGPSGALVESGAATRARLGFPE